MIAEEIKELYQRIDKRAQERLKNNSDSNKDDDHVAQIANTPGWEIVKGQIENMIVELLEPVKFKEETPLDVRGATNEARMFGLDVARKILGMVETVKLVKQIQKEEKEREEAKQKEAEGGNSDKNV